MLVAADHWPAGPAGTAAGRIAGAAKGLGEAARRAHSAGTLHAGGVCVRIVCAFVCAFVFVCVNFMQTFMPLL